MTPKLGAVGTVALLPAPSLSQRHEGHETPGLERDLSKKKKISLTPAAEGAARRKHTSEVSTDIEPPGKKLPTWGMKNEK